MMLLPRCQWILLLGGFCALSSALIGEHVFGLLACKLCHIQQGLYFGVIVFSGLSILLCRRWLYWVAVFGLSVEFIVAFYHVGLEKGLFTDLLGCSDSSARSYDSFDDYKNALLDLGKKVSCSKPALVVLGISMAGWNAIYSVILLLWTIVLEFKYGKVIKDD